MTAQTSTVQNPDESAGKAVLDTVKANRAWALASYIDACDNLGITPDPAMKAELEAMTDFYSVDDPAEEPAADQVHIEVASYPGTLGSYGEGVAEGDDIEQVPALAGMTVEGLIHVTLTFRGEGTLVIGIQNLSEEDLPVLVENSEAAGHLYDGVVPVS